MKINFQKAHIRDAKVSKYSVGSPSVIFKLLTENLYKRPLEACIREYITNARDAHRESKQEKPIEVKLYIQDQIPYISIRDFGPGLSKERLFKYFTKLGGSTKRSTNELIGGFGIGCKSGFAYSPIFVVKNRYDGVETVYSAVRSSVPKLVEVSKKKTDETGVEIIIPLKPEDAELAFKYANKYLKYWANNPYVNENAKLIITDDFKETYLTDYLYEIDGPEIDLSKSLVFLHKDLIIDKDDSFLDTLLIDYIPYEIPDSLFTTLRNETLFNVLFELRFVPYVNLPLDMVQLSVSRDDIQGFNGSSLVKQHIKQVIGESIDDILMYIWPGGTSELRLSKPILELFDFCKDKLTQFKGTFKIIEFHNPLNREVITTTLYDLFRQLYEKRKYDIQMHFVAAPDSLLKEKPAYARPIVAYVRKYTKFIRTHASNSFVVLFPQSKLEEFTKIFNVQVITIDESCIKRKKARRSTDSTNTEVDRNNLYMEVGPFKNFPRYLPSKSKEIMSTDLYRIFVRNGGEWIKSSVWKRYYDIENLDAYLKEANERLNKYLLCNKLLNGKMDTSDLLRYIWSYDLIPTDMYCIMRNQYSYDTIQRWKIKEIRKLILPAVLDIVTSFLKSLEFLSEEDIQKLLDDVKTYILR